MKKIKINRNILWTETFVAELVNAGVKYACISPGSRSTPLTYAFATNKKVKSFALIDERSSGFFALGLAKATKTPAALVCTSGTAAAEFYPAIIEAYQSKVPLIVCTADRPPELQNIGANQTINQNNIYKNHICWFADAGLPQATKNGVTRISSLAKQAILESSVNNLGPVHINFPFKEPFEPNTHTDEIDSKDLPVSLSKMKFLLRKMLDADAVTDKMLNDVAVKVKSHPKGIIVVGLDNYSKGFYSACSRISQLIGYPVLADAASNMRFAYEGNHNILTSYDSYLRSENFVKLNKPEFIIQFGRNFSSKALSNFIAKCDCKKVLVNQFGNWKNPKDKSTSILAADPELFCKELIKLTFKKTTQQSKWLNEFLTIEKNASKIKASIFGKTAFPNETKIVSEVVDALPARANLMISNSLPIRDFDLIVPLMKKSVSVYYNRGASGIDGIISTALGIAQSSKQRTYLLTGDLAFYYDLNSLHVANKFSIPIIIILINNNGGRIFEVLPISKYKKVFEDYFATPHNLEFKDLVLAFGGIHCKIKSWNHFKKLLTNPPKQSFSVLEIKTDPIKSLSLRRKYYEKVISLSNHNSKTLL